MCIHYVAATAAKRAHTGYGAYKEFSRQDEKRPHGATEERMLISYTGFQSQTPEIAVSHHQRIITGDGVRLREGPSTQTGILKQPLEPGLIVKVVAKTGNWLKIEYSFRKGEKTAGWVFAEYAQPLKTLH